MNRSLLVLACVSSFSRLAAAEAPADPLPPAVEAQLLLGPFEGHGLPYPTDAKKARRARIVAQRLSFECYAVSEQRGGGTMPYSRTCDMPKVTAADVPAILDKLDDVTVNTQGGWTGSYAFGRMTEAVGASGRSDVVPVLVTALERIAARAPYAELFFTALNDDVRFASIDGALATLTFHRVERTNDGTDLAEAAAAWRTWWEEHQGETPKAWRQAAIDLARERAAGDDPQLRIAGFERLRDIRETRAEAQRLARAFAKDHPDEAWRVSWALPQR
jgi:hypothetical protein